jgi:hypothetical protein
MFAIVLKNRVLEAKFFLLENTSFYYFIFFKKCVLTLTENKKILIFFVVAKYTSFLFGTAFLVPKVLFKLLTQSQTST